MKVYSFPHGGISFDDPASPRRGSSVLSFLPSAVVVPLTALNGSRALPVVSTGERVREGQLIARRQGAGSANIYSPVPGAVVDNSALTITHEALCDSMVIRTEGSFSMLGKREETRNWRNFSALELRELITEMGVVEMDGAGMPLSDVFSLYQRSDTTVSLVVRCVFDDPWLAADYVLIRERLEAVAAGAVIAARAVCAREIIVAVSSPESALGAELSAAITAAQNEKTIPSTMILVGSRYPQRNTRELELALRQCERKEKRDFGELLFMGPATFAAVFDAVALRRPVLDRYVAVGGSAVRHPQILRARLGCRLAQIFEECGGFTARPKRVAFGSPLSGRPVFSLDEPLTTASYAVFAVNEEKAGFIMNPRVLDLRQESRLGYKPEKKSETPAFMHGYARSHNCIGCGECRVVCPVGLDPEDLYKMLSTKTYTSRLAELTRLCHGCGCCEAVCPSRLPLSRLIIDPSGEGS